MRNVLFSANTFVSFESSSPKKISQPSLFRRFLQALHHSRRLQAERTLRQYRHLIDRERHRFDQMNIGGPDDVPK